MTQTRTRFAPSPSGFLHLGNARTALFAFLFAKHTGGRFILRIEDTDLERIVAGSEVGILQDLKWLKLEWDEGPDRGGPLGPYRCSERMHIYEAQLKRIQKETRVYRCFCSPDQLDQDRKLLSSQKKVIKYVGRCLNLSEAQATEKAKTTPYVWRMHVPEGAPVAIEDIVRGHVEMQRDVLGDFVIFRSTGVPVFLFQNAIDDALQEMTHVIRGEDHLSNTFRQVLIYDALKLKVPTFSHLPMIGAEDGGKLSKRLGSLSIKELREEGFLPQGITNYLALLGWSPGDTAVTGEKFNLEELGKAFDLNRVHKGRALFDFQKLRFLNQQHLHDLNLDQLLELAPCKLLDWSAEWKSAIELVKHDAATVNDLYKVESFLNKPSFDQNEAAQKILKTDNARKALEMGISEFKTKVHQNPAVEISLKESIQSVGKAIGLKGKDLFFPFRVAITGVEAGPELIPLAKILGAPEVQSRLEKAFEYSKA
ncbi:MAG: glutamate--tRNA ligase [Deltaproteobacteria bacterium]|nr:glutamate--tRNA ligase [Deltaproteobacteria bacterium]